MKIALLAAYPKRIDNIDYLQPFFFEEKGGERKGGKKRKKKKRGQEVSNTDLRPTVPNFLPYFL